MQYIPYNRDLSQSLESQLSTTPYGSVSQFIQLYNSDILNKNNKDVVDLSNNIAETYKNLQIKNRTFIVKSNEEVQLDTSLNLLSHLPPVVILKRLANELVEAGYSEATQVIFKKSAIGVPHLEQYGENEVNAVVYSFPEKVFKNEKEMTENLFLKKYAYEHNEHEEGSTAFTLEDIIAFDVSFIASVGETLELALSEHE